MITVRNLLPTDILTTPHWNLYHRPNPDTTLVAINDDGKICGIWWLAYAGEAAMIALWLSADSNAFGPLYIAGKELAKRMGCAMILCHIDEGKHCDIAAKRGWVISTRVSHAAGLQL